MTTGNSRDPKQKGKNEVGEFTLSDFKIYRKATVIESVWCWHKINTDPWIELRVQK